jgi:hypothetical protein
MGVVYEARDRATGQTLALKTLLKATPNALYMFKREFRGLADVDHPNLVRLHEFAMSGSGRVFFTMELVRGTDFVSYAQGATAQGLSWRQDLSTRRTSSGKRALRDRVDRPSSNRPGGDGLRTAVDLGSKRPLRANLDRLRPSLVQLVDGVMALHAARKLHRDIKPSNVLVTLEGRVVLLDFGVATDLSRAAEDEMREEELLVGTATYMAPEQAFEEPTPACDWYSVGVMLYESMVGQPPFMGSVADVLSMKTTVDPPIPSELVEGVPADLDALCRALLQREPGMRPPGSEILQRLGVTRASPERAASTWALRVTETAAAAGLVGREAHLRALGEAFDAACARGMATVRIGGRAGVGKSALVQWFVDDLVERRNAVVLRGRAYEREAMPYKAIDGVVDSLTRYLICLNDEELASVLPPDAWTIARLFPVLRRVPALETMPAEPIADPQRARRRAFRALRDLLGALARRRPLVLFIDDVHWGDTDSAALLLELARPPDAPSLLLAMTYRDEQEATSAFLSELKAGWPREAGVGDLAVGALAPPDAQRLARTLLGNEDHSTEIVAAIAGESGGNPFLIEELARSVGPQLRGRTLSAVDASSALASLTLDRMVSDRMQSLPEAARRLLELVAVSGRPLPVAVARRATDAVRGADDELISLLRTRRFLRAGLRDGHEVLEVVHARIREAIAAWLGSAAVRERHADLARALEAVPGVDVEALVTHLLGAGDLARAAQFAERAAEGAAEKLAFDQAARLLHLTLDTFPATSQDGSRLRKRRAEFLEWAGRGAEAGRAYLDAAQGVAGIQKLDLQRAAAEQLHASGCMDEGTEVLHQVLAAVNRKAPRSKWTALFWFLAYHVWLRLVGLRVRERDAGEVSAEDRLRIDSMYSVTLGFAMVDHLKCISMRVRVLVDALRHGDRLQVARTAASVAYDLAGNTASESKTERALWALSQRLADKEKNPALSVTLRTFHGCNLLRLGRWREALKTLDPIVAMITNRRAAQQTAILFTFYALYFLGDCRELTQRYARLIAEAEERGNVFMAMQLRAIAAVPAWLAGDEPQRAHRELQVAAQWTQGMFSTQWRVAVFGVDLDLYVGDGAAAYTRVQGLERARKDNLYLLHYVRVLTAFARGRAAVASLAGLSRGARRHRLAEARRLERQLRRWGMPWTEPLAAILRAGCACASGDRAGAAAALSKASETAQAADMPVHAAAARHQLGVLLGVDEDASPVREADETMTAHGVRAPAKFAAMLVPLYHESGVLGLRRFCT